MRTLLLFPFLTGLAALAIVACGDDPGATGLPYFYPPDAAYDGVDLDALVQGEP